MYAKNSKESEKEYQVLTFLFPQTFHLQCLRSLSACDDGPCVRDDVFSLAVAEIWGRWSFCHWVWWSWPEWTCHQWKRWSWQLGLTFCSRSSWRSSCQVWAPPGGSLLGELASFAMARVPRCRSTPAGDWEGNLVFFNDYWLIKVHCNMIIKKCAHVVVLRLEWYRKYTYLPKACNT